MPALSRLYAILGDMSSRISRFDNDGNMLPEVAAVILNISRTLEVDLAVHPWVNEDQGIDLVICDSRYKPTAPVWEVRQIVSGEGDCLAVHPWLMQGDDTLDEAQELLLSLRELEDSAQQMACISKWLRTGFAPDIHVPPSNPKRGRGMNRGEWT